MGKFNLTTGTEIHLDHTAASITVGDMWVNFGDMNWNSTFCACGDSPPPYSWIDQVTVHNDVVLLVQLPKLKEHVDKAPTVAEIRDKIMKVGRLDKLVQLKLMHVKLMYAVYRPVLGIKIRHNEHGSLPSCQVVLGESLGDLGYFE